MSTVEIRRGQSDEIIEAAFAIRRDVFVDEQGVPEAVEIDGLDDQAMHVLALVDDDEPVGTARIRYKSEDVVKPERVAVRSDYRGRGIGKQLMVAVEDEARDAAVSTLLIHAQTRVEPFYSALGYERISDEFDEAGIPHVKMEKRLE